MKIKSALVLIAMILCISELYRPLPPLFSVEFGEYAFYLESASSSAQRITVNSSLAAKTKVKLGRVYGESVYLSFDSYSKEDCVRAVRSVCEHYGASLALVEEGEWGVSYYLYSPTIRASALCVNGKRVNVHVATDGKGITLGAPLIFGGY